MYRYSIVCDNELNLVHVDIVKKTERQFGYANARLENNYL